MSKINLHIPPELLESLKRLKETKGIPISEQIRRAIKNYLGSESKKDEK